MKPQHNVNSGRFFRINRMCEDNSNMTTKEHRDMFIARMYECDDDTFDILYDNHFATRKEKGACS